MKVHRFLVALFLTTVAVISLSAKIAVAAVLIQGVAVSGDPLSNLIVAAGAAVSVYALGAVKRTDSKITNSPVYRKLQPFLALGGAIGLPLLAGKIGVQVDPQALLNAPLATLFSVGVAELGSHFLKRRDT